MFYRVIYLLTLSSVISLAQAEDINTKSFDGRWCGKWDKIYTLCVEINDIENNPIAKYQWRERINGKFQKTTKRITMVNPYTIKLENIWITLDKNDLTKAKAIGMFSQQTRYADLKKFEEESQ